ncbi:MAG: hypothetical protein AB7P14_18975 [Blastocatellales bacterium]
MPAQSETRDKLISFAYLPLGWNFGEGVPAKELPLKRAFAILEALENIGFYYTDAYPGLDGGILLSAYALPDYYDFKINLDGYVNVIHTRGEEDLFSQEAMSITQVINKIKEFASQKCPTSDYSTSAFTTARNSDDSRVLLLQTPVPLQGSPLLTSTAPSTPVAIFVNIVQNSTPQLQARRSFTGKSRMNFLKTDAI